METAVALLLQQQGPLKKDEVWGGKGVGWKELIATAVGNSSLEGQARLLGIDRVLRGGVGERSGRILANALEAVCAALYIEGGLSRAEIVLKELVREPKVEWVKELERELKIWSGTSIRLTQIRDETKGGGEYVQVVMRIVDSRGLNTHQAMFTCRVDAVMRKKMGTGRVQSYFTCLGSAEKKSKDEAQQAAAQAAVKALQGEQKDAGGDVLKFLQVNGWVSGVKESASNSGVIRRARQTKLFRRNEEMKDTLSSKEFMHSRVNAELSTIRARELFRFIFGVDIGIGQNDSSSEAKGWNFARDDVTLRRLIGTCAKKLWAAEQGFLCRGSMSVANQVYVDLIHRGLLSYEQARTFRRMMKREHGEVEALRTDALEAELFGWLLENKGWIWMRKFLRQTLGTVDLKVDNISANATPSESSQDALSDH